MRREHSSRAPRGMQAYEVAVPLLHPSRRFEAVFYQPRARRVPLYTRGLPHAATPREREIAAHGCAILHGHIHAGRGGGGGGRRACENLAEFHGFILRRDRRAPGRHSLVGYVRELLTGTARTVLPPRCCPTPRRHVRPHAVHACRPDAGRVWTER